MSETLQGHLERQPEHPAGGAGGDSVRVVLVGRTGLEDRLGDGIEHVCARTPLEAVGEIASAPISDRRTVLVVAPDAEPNGSLASFLEAVREADPGVRIARASRDGLGGRDGYDAVVGPDASAATIRRLVARDRSTDSGTGTVLTGASPALPDTDSVSEVKAVSVVTAVSESKTDVAAAEETVTAVPPILDPAVVPEPKPIDARTAPDSPIEAGESEPVAESSGIGDARVIAALDGSREAVLSAAIGLIAERLKVEEIVFVEQGQADTDTSPVPSVPVTAGTKRFGSVRASGLGSDHVTAAGLVPHAVWLGSWLAMHDRQQSLRRAAFTDPLTGAWNRRYFDGFLESALDRARSARRTVTVLVFDIDEFKRYNDDYGHPAGDEILIETVRALKSSVRPSDRVCRIGGDEFAVIFDEPGGPRVKGSQPPESVYILAKRVQRQIGEKKFPKLGADAAGRLTISGGLAAFPWDGHDAEALLQKADDLARESKHLGKNAITVGPGAERVCKHAGDDLAD